MACGYLCFLAVERNFYVARLSLEDGLKVFIAVSGMGL